MGEGVRGAEASSLYAASVGAAGARRAKGGATQRAKGGAFRKEVERAASALGMASALKDGGESLEELLDAVHIAGDALKAAPSQETIVGYRQAVRAFLARVVDEGYAVEESVSGNNILKRKKFMVVRLVDAKLDALAADLLLNQKEQLGLLERIEEIKGLLIDLLQ
jgi:hypothetical protein